MDTYPKLRDLSFLQAEDFPIGENWQITVMKDDDVLWSIVLAYLNSFEESNKSELHHHVVTLLGKEVGRDVKKNVEKCNLFLYNNACFRNETINYMVQTFHDRINNYYKKNRNEDTHEDTLYKCLQASSELLKLNIMLYNDSNHSVQWFSNVLKPIDSKILVIFVNYSCDSGPSFSFCISRELGDRKQKLALQNILKKTQYAERKRNLTPVIHTICSLPGLRENFLIALLESDVAEYIPLIYKSPYILSKLRDAAFKTDPKIENSEGKSALFYALTKKASNLLYFLYDHAVNACFQTSGIERTVDSAIVVNLIAVKNLLTDMTEKVEASNLDINVKNNSLRKLDELSRFNDFQTEVCRSINFARSTSPSGASNVNEANERRNIIQNILCYYEKYFEWNNEVGPHEGEIALFQDFCKHVDYYDNLDFCSAIMFFDNLFLLKERLILPKKEYSKVESNFYLFIYLKNYLESIVKKYPHLHPVSRRIIYQERLALKNHLRSFKKLKVIKINTCISETKTVDKLPKSEVRTLRNIPQIYGEFLVLRLKHYFRAVANINIMDFKAVLILERTLQVIGECIKEGEEETDELNEENVIEDKDFKSVQKVFSLIIPEGLSSILRQIRNELVHPKDLINFSYRISAEEDYELFDVIRKEILTLEGIFNVIFCAQKYKKEIYVTSHIQSAIENAKKLHDDSQWKMLFDELSSSMTSSLNTKEKVINKNSVWQLKYIFDNSFCALKRKVISMKNKCFNVRASIDYMDDDFFSIEYIFSYLILKDIKHDLKRKFEIKQQEREDLFESAQTYDNEVFHEQIEAILSDYEQIKEKIFLTTNCQPKKRLHFSFEHIEKFKKILKEKCYLNGTEKKTILRSIPEYIRKTLETKCKLKRFLEGKGCLKLNKTEFGEEINKLSLMPGENQELLDDFDLENTKNSLYIVNSVLGNFYPELQDALSKNELNDKKQYEGICNGLKLPDSSRDILSKIIKRTPREVQENRLNFLRNRLKQLKAILINEDASIKKLWESPQSTRKKSYVHELLVNVYLNDPGTQAAVEMLLSDCMNILMTKENTHDLKYLYRKTTNLLNGINLRNVLAHGNPLLESLGRLLDPRDLPSELVRKMMDLISDLEIIETILDILDKIGHDYDVFNRFMNLDKEDEFKDLRKKVASSHNWKQYAKLINQQQGSTTASPSSNRLTGDSAGDSSNDAQGPSEPEAQDKFSGG